MTLTQEQSRYPFLELMWTMLVFFAWVIWFWLLITIFADLFRRSDISGWGKAGWTVLLLVVPFLGVLIYLIAQGRQMGERRRAAAEAAQSHFEDYVRAVAAPHDGTTSQIAEAKRLLDDGAINDQEYQALKAKVLSR
ncbi:hypothetical protein DMH04_54115 [Kibdelosporangium aridum]|uniref:Phospholipase_D-nuclease N-terminal n=1 Tax=Kibdelosporangium aridum TaxID=2030 RepID=A0A428XYT7_KIBAR|nr:SHOCT domain-containing protein [Kibdelosporangium aridum]RSM60384.1 hypothetical protein DMH04_54115 [Kibdelosporangium aridum]